MEFFRWLKLGRISLSNVTLLFSVTWLYESIKCKKKCWLQNFQINNGFGENLNKYLKKNQFSIFFPISICCFWCGNFPHLTNPNQNNTLYSFKLVNF